MMGSGSNNKQSYNEAREARAALQPIKPRGVSNKNAVVEQMEKRKMARHLIVTTVTFKIKKQLRLLGQPITLFGEQPENRRERLRYALIELTEEQRIKVTGIGHSGSFGTFGDGQNKEIEERHKVLAEKQIKEIVNKETWFHQGDQELYLARKSIAQHSIPAAKRRIREYRNLVKDQNLMNGLNREIQRRQNKIREGIDQVASAVADTRPVSTIKFSPDDKKMVTASWAGNLSVWNVPECQKIWNSDQSLADDSGRGHVMGVGDVAWHPSYGLANETDIHMASCSFDGEVKLWNLEQNEPLGDLGGHLLRVSRLAFYSAFINVCPISSISARHSSSLFIVQF